MIVGGGLKMAQGVVKELFVGCAGRENWLNEYK